MLHLRKQSILFYVQFPTHFPFKQKKLTKSFAIPKKLLTFALAYEKHGLKTPFQTFSQAFIRLDPLAQ